MRTKQQPKKSKLTVTNYQMKFETLEQMVCELVELHPEMKNIFHLEDNDRITPRYLQDEALEYFTLNEPNVIDGINLPVAIIVNANGVTLKTAKYFSVKWNFKYDKTGFVQDITATVSTFIKDENKVSETLLAMIDKLDEKWSVVEK